HAEHHHQRDGIALGDPRHGFVLGTGQHRAQYTRKLGTRRRGGEMTRWTLALSAAVVAAGALPASPLRAAPKYYFQLQPVKAGPEVSADLKAFTGEALKTELAARPEWASDVGPAGQQGPGSDRTALVAELKKRNLRGFDVTARIEKLKQE